MNALVHRDYSIHTEGMPIQIIMFEDRMEMEKYNLMPPQFLDERGSFIVKFFKNIKPENLEVTDDEETNNLIMFCKTPRTRREICEYLGLSSVTYAIQKRVMPFVETGKIKMSIPGKPKSPKQLYYSE